jgi:FHA domain-containing protein
MPRLVLKTDGAQAEGIELRPGRNRLGRGPDNDFLIEHPTVSTTHCEVVCEEGGIRVRDCDSTNGTFINLVPIREANLNPGDTLQLGDVELVLTSAPAKIAIPTLPVEGADPAPLADGAVACFNHASTRARRQCSQCQKCFCDTCVHTVRRVGGNVLRLCPLCSGRCDLLPGAERKRKKKSFFGALWALKKTLKISRK